MISRSIILNIILQLIFATRYYDIIENFIFSFNTFLSVTLCHIFYLAHNINKIGFLFICNIKTKS